MKAVIIAFTFSIDCLISGLISKEWLKVHEFRSNITIISIIQPVIYHSHSLYLLEALNGYHIQVIIASLLNYILINLCIQVNNLKRFQK